MFYGELQNEWNALRISNNRGSLASVPLAWDSAPSKIIATVLPPLRGYVIVWAPTQDDVRRGGLVLG